MSRKRKLGRATAHRIAMLRALVTFLFEHGKIEIKIDNNDYKISKNSTISSKDLINASILKKYKINKKTLDKIIDYVIECQTFENNR